jgi:DNA-binding transcriptional regulator YhcF (GntR family)
MGAKLETIKQLGGQLFLTPGLSYKVLNKLHLEIIIPNIVTIQYIVTEDETATEQTKQRQFLFNSSLNSSGNGLTFIGVGFHFIL